MRLVLIGLVAGVFSSLFGVGGGIVIVPLLIMGVGFAAKEASAVSLGAIAITALAGVTLYALHGKVNIGHAALVGLPAMAGAIAGASVQRRLSGPAFMGAFACLLAGLGVWLLLG